MVLFDFLCYTLCRKANEKLDTQPNHTSGNLAYAVARFLNVKEV